MFGLKSTLCFVFVAVCFAPSHQKPVGDDKTLESTVQSLLTNDGKVNNSGASAMPMAVDMTRSAFYPTSGGLGYYNLGQTQFPIQHYPLGMPHQTYQTPILSNTMFKNEEASRTDARTLGLGHGLRPSLYSQYQSVPLSYSYPVQSYQVQPYSYEYSSPVVSGFGGHYSGYSSYPYFRDAEEEKPRQFSNVMPVISPVRPSVQYTSKYLMGKPFENYENLFQSPMTQQMPLMIRNSMPAEWNQPQERALTIDDQLQLQIPHNYLLEKLQHYTPSNEARSPMVAQPLMTRAAEEPKPFDWNQNFINQPMSYKNGGFGQLVPDPFISPDDSVYVEPYVGGEPTHHVQGSRSAEPLMMGTFPNHDQQLRIAQMQFYHNAMNNAADHIEPINREYLNQRMFLPTYPVRMDPLANQRMFFPNTQGVMGSRSMDDSQNLLSQVQGITKNVEALMEANKSESKSVKNDTPKEEKKEQMVTGGKQGDMSATGNAQTRRI